MTRRLFEIFGFLANSDTIEHRHLLNPIFHRYKKEHAILLIMETTVPVKRARTERFTYTNNSLNKMQRMREMTSNLAINLIFR